MDLTDQQWTIIEPLFEEKRRPDGRGRPWRDARAVLNGVLWVLRTGAPWHDLPDRYPPYHTCHRRFQQWRKNGVFRDLLTCLAEDLRLRGKIDLTEGFIDASFTPAKKGGSVIGPTKRGKGNKIMAIVDRRSLPVAVHVACASTHEVRLVDATLEDRFIAPYPPRLIGDRAYDSDRLDAALWTSFGIELIAPHRDNRVRPTQDGRALRRYKRRWVVERFFAWLHNSRRLVTRWERHVENFVAMLQLGCMRILLNRYEIASRKRAAEGPVEIWLPVLDASGQTGCAPRAPRGQWSITGSVRGRPATYTLDTHPPL